MAKKDIKFTLDTIDSRYSPVGTVKQLDSVFFYIKITENGVTKDLTGQTIKLFAKKEDKKIVEQTTKINITNQSEGLVEIELLNAAIQVHGFTYFELEISDNTGIISTADFILRVNKRVASDEAIESTNEVSTLKEIEVYVAQAKQEIKEFKKLQNKMLKTNENININEEARVTAEEKRSKAEIEREKIIKEVSSKIDVIENSKIDKIEKDGNIIKFYANSEEKYAVNSIEEGSVNTINVEDNAITINKLNENMQDLYDVRYRSINDGLLWNEGYISFTGEIENIEGYNYSKINVLPGERYRISCRHNWRAVGYLIKDSDGNVVGVDSGSNSESTIIETEFTIPAKGTELYVNNRNRELKFLQIKDRIKLKIKNESINFKHLELSLQKVFNFSYREIENMEWVEGSYVKSDGTIVKATEEYGYCKINVKEDDVFRINGVKRWQASCYLIKDFNGNVIKHDGRPDSEQTPVNEIFTIPQDGVELYISKFGFVSLELKDSVYLNFKDNSIPFKSLSSELRDNFKLCFKDVDKIEWVQKHYVTQDGVITPIEDSSYSYAKISVLPGEEYRITGQKVWSSSCYVVKDARGNVVLHDNKPSGAKTDVVNEIFTIPSDGVELYVGGRGFKYLEKKSELINSRITSNLRDKLIVFNGDSICQGIVNGGGYAEILRKTTGCLIENRAVGGGTLAINKANKHMICNDIVNMNDNADLVILEGGINDYWQNIPMGEMKPLNDFTSEVDKETVLGALESIFRTCMDKWLGVPIIFVIVHPVADTRYLPNSVGYTFEQLVEGIRKMCKKYSIAIVDLLNESGGFNGNVERIAKKYTINGGDGCHPNEEGYTKYYVPQIKAKAESIIS
ncbi:GDSL-type esterase/lipase family protein [Clostridium perfringens]